MIDILTGTAFDAPKRLHHREDEVALESGVGSRSRGLLALKAQNLIASNGEDMETITCENDQWGVDAVKAWFEGLVADGKVPAHCALFAKDFAFKQYDELAHYNSVIVMFNDWNGAYPCIVTSANSPNYITRVGYAGLTTCGIKGGQQYYVVDRAAPAK